MKNRKMLAFLLCAALLCTVAGFALGTGADVHDHEHDHGNEALQLVLASPLIENLSAEPVPLADGPDEEQSQNSDPAPVEPAPQSDPVEAPPTTPSEPEPKGEPSTPPATEPPTNPDPTTPPATQPPATQPPATQTETPPASTTVPPHDHQWKTYRSEQTGFNCELGESWIAYDRCTICGIEQQRAFRQAGTGGGGSHQWVDVATYAGVCPSKTVVDQKCSRCGQTQTLINGSVGGSTGHQWGPWSSVTGDACTGTHQERSCQLCGEKETKGSTGSHLWVHHVTAATCTTGGMSWDECSRCGAKTNQQTLDVRAHKWEADDGDCTTPIKCSICGAVVQKAMSHRAASSWSSDNVNHWKACANPGCTARLEVSAHSGTTSNDCTRLSNCSVCGLAGGASGKQHNFDGSGGYIIASLGGHQIRCSNPGCTQVSGIIPHDKPSATATSCTEGQDCVCGYNIVSAKGNHAFGPWTSTSAGHSRTCTKCGYVESATHTGRSSGNGGCTNSVVCSTCGYVLSQGYSSHSFGVWMSNGSTHFRTCTHPGCTATQSSSHTGGKGTCSSGPVCAVCGASYGSKAASNHVGGTELRNVKPAEVGKAGYTGDIYCLGCGTKISTGTTIKALEKNHEHNFTGGWKSDSSGHWQVCSCGDRGSLSSHSFANGKCTVCGAADPSYKTCSGGNHVGGTELRNAKPAEVGKAGYTGDLYCTPCGTKISTGTAIKALAKNHEHDFSIAWRSDGAHHWKDCSCGETTRMAAHSFVNGVCSVCGATDPNAETVHTHTFGDYHTNGQYHWRECTSCGFQAEKASHVMLNGACMSCGYEMPVMEKVKDVSTKDWYYDNVKQVLEAGLLSGGKSASENTSFNPKEKVVLSEVADALYRLAGSPAAASENKFTDVKVDDYYASAASWVTANNIVDIYGESFDGSKVTTLQEMVTFLWRFAKTAGWNVDASGAADLPNADEIDEWAEEAMAWASEVGLTDGIDESAAETMSPAGVVTRAEAAAILANFMSLIETNGLSQIENGVEEVAI